MKGNVAGPIAATLGFLFFTIPMSTLIFGSYVEGVRGIATIDTLHEVGLAVISVALPFLVLVGAALFVGILAVLGEIVSRIQERKGRG